MENDWSDDYLCSPERALFVVRQYMAIDARRKIEALKGRSVTHLDGNSFNNDMQNLRIVERGENHGRAR